MRFDSVDVTSILGLSFSSNSNNSDENEGGFLTKIFKKKKYSENIFEEAIAKYGRGRLADELSDEDYILAYTVDSNQTKLYVVLTENFLILPGQDIIELASITKYGLFNVLDPDFAQYAEDRINVPYDPSYVSEYEGEERYELDRFSIMFAFVTDMKILYKYTLYMDLADRKEFHEYLSARIDTESDFTSDLIFDGKFEDDSLDNPYKNLVI